MLKLISFLSILLFFNSLTLFAGNKIDADSLFIKYIFDEALSNGRSYANLRELCKKVGHRLSGSKNAEKAVFLMQEIMKKEGFDTVYLQPCYVPKWERGEKEQLKIKVEGKWQSINCLALGGSIGTKGILEGEIIIVYSLDELKKLGKEKVEGKIVLFNREMEPRNINTFKSYGSCVDQRVWGAAEAAELGAKAVLVRSMTHKNDTHPHTGTLIYKNKEKLIPGAAISFEDADNLEKWLSTTKIYAQLKMSCKVYPDELSYNVIGEIWGENKNSYLLTGGHLDSWDVGEGAHDDGAGCVHSIEAISLLNRLGYRPNNSLKVVLFMNEENGLRGATAYADSSKNNNIKHKAAIESDRGGFAPRGFSLDGPLESMNLVKSWRNILEYYGLHDFKEGGTGADINPLKANEPYILLMGFLPESQRYFDHHHATTDLFESVNRRELELGSASIAAMLYLLDQYLP